MAAVPQGVFVIAGRQHCRRIETADPVARGVEFGFETIFGNVTGHDDSVGLEIANILRRCVQRILVFAAKMQIGEMNDLQGALLRVQRQHLGAALVERDAHSGKKRARFAVERGGDDAGSVDIPGFASADFDS